VSGDPTNEAIADRLLALASLLELAEASPFAARAYRRAADLVRTTPASVGELIRAGRVRELRGIGPGIEARLRELVETGDIAELRELELDLRPELVGIGRLAGVGARRMAEIGRILGISTADELRAAVADGQLQAVPGVGPVTIARVSTALEERREPRLGLTLNRARALCDAIASALGGATAGDARRCLELSRDLSVVCSAERPGPVLDAFAALPGVVAALERVERRAVGVTVEGVPVTLVVALPQRFGTELVRATGSPEFVATLGELPTGATEDDVFDALGRPWLPPELRELPSRVPAGPLLELSDVRGDLHCHTTWSDGRASVLEMGRGARERGYEYLAICDHTTSVRVVPGLDRDAVRRQAEEIREANEQLTPFRVLAGIECDILPDGSLDLDDETLSTLDWVQVSLHAGQRRSREELTRIVTEAMRSPYARALSHP